MSKLSGPMLLVAAFGGFFLALFIVFLVLDTEFFRGDPDLGGSAIAAKTGKTDLAYQQCREEAAREARQELAKGTEPPDYTAWDLGFGRYLIKARLGQPSAPGRTFLCRIAGRGDGWTVEGMEYLE
jgi:hypothetical protein